MRIYCNTCFEHILFPTDKFILGGPYDGAMFENAVDDNWATTMFVAETDTVGGDLFCPRCTGLFIADGKLLTEHGIVQPGQKTIDKSFSIIHHGGSIDGWIKKVEDSKEKCEQDTEAEIEDEKITSGYTVLPDGPGGGIIPKIKQDDEQWGESIPDTVDKFKQKATTEGLGSLICPKCGKEYRNTERGKYWYDKHIEDCKA